jgi:hypothetical protein
MHGHRLIFIAGLHRSGTSVLFRSIRDHPQVSGFENTPSPEDEGMHLQSVYHPSGHYGGGGRFGFHPEAHLTEASPLITEENRRKLFAEWGHYWDLEKPYLLEKSPPNLIRTRFLQAMFPGAYFIVAVRHPIAVSYATRAWYRAVKVNWVPLPQLIEHWMVCHEIFQEDSAHLENVFILKYEHFVARPEHHLGRIYAFLGLEDHPTTQEVRPHVNEKYFAKWRGRAENRLSRHTVDTLIGKHEARANRFGYSLIDLERAD